MIAYHRELLQQASDLVTKSSPTQADLRRSVSGAYYALFHLLISETVAHWSLDTSRGALARMFEHSLMKRVSRRTSDPNQHPLTGEDPSVVKQLRDLAESFVRLQEKRHVADYDNAVLWTKSQAFEEVDRASEAFITWQSIRHHKIAQDYLVSLLIKPRD